MKKPNSIIPSTKLLCRKIIPNFPDYVITKDGQVWSKSRKRTRKEKQLKFRDNAGHLMVALYNNKKRYDLYVHSLVLKTFVGPCPEGMECRHLDGNSKNNNVDNLCWGTHKENAQDAVRHGTSGGFKYKGEDVNTAKLTEQDVRLIFSGYWDGAYSLTELAKHFNITVSGIYSVVNKISWRHLWNE